jgi:hypothetical protein
VSQTTQTYTLAADLANFTGTENIPVASAFDDVFSFQTIGGHGSWSIMTSGSASAQVIYDFTPIPEPSTCGLLLAGLGGLLVRARHKKR